MTATPALTTDLKAQVKLLADDLRKRLESDSELLAKWQRIHNRAVAKDRTAMSWLDWREDRIDQASVAWVLTTVFIRFCEDNSLVEPVWISGPAHRRQEALDAQLAYFRWEPEHSDREWLNKAINYLRKLPAVGDLVDAHSALEYVSPSGDAVSRLLEFWRQRGDDGALIHDLNDDSLSTRFLGDLYQDLSDYAREKYALLQTPIFVEEHILDRTLEPALNDRPLDGFRMIDPACGSGHFLLGAFDRLLDRWHRQAPGMEVQARVQTALDSIHGVDINPFAVAISRFRLTVAALKACGLRSLENAPAFNFHLAAGDSLIHGPDENVIPGLEDRASFMPFHYSTEDGQLLLEILTEGRYDAVVGNPPYITVKDKAINRTYRSKFGKACKGTYQLTVPFIIQFFSLAKNGEQSGWVGMISSNAFMDQDFGAPLIEQFLARRDLILVEDTSGAIIPGHGTPTIIIVGRNRSPARGTVRAVLGVRGEPGHLDDAAEGIVWMAIDKHSGDIGWDDGWITVTDLDRKLLASHPWSLRGGGAIPLQERLERESSRLHEKVRSIGYTGQTNSDEVFLTTTATASRHAISKDDFRAFLTGIEIRDFRATPRNVAIFPYRSGELLPLEVNGSLYRWFWPFRIPLGARATFGGSTYAAEGRPWWSWHQVAKSKLSGPALTWPVVQTHNHFVYLRESFLHNRHAPIVQLETGATDEDYIKLLGILNSSTACFWLKQVSHDKGNGGIGGGIGDEPWEPRYEFTGNTLQNYPLPTAFPLNRAWLLDSLAQELSTREPSTICESGVPSREVLIEAQRESEQIQIRMIAVQDEMDWEVYRLCSVIDEDLTYSGDDLPGLALGERAFEIALARSGEQTAWFERHGSTPIIDIPERWPEAYRELVQCRLDLIAGHPYIKLLERPEYKRRWQQEPWEKRQERALRNWLLDRLEDRKFWFDSQTRPSPRSVAQLADDVTRDADMVSVLALWEGRPDISVADSLKRLLEEEVVPFHSGYRYKESGLRKREAWEETWSFQRRQDSGEKIDIQAPPKYTSADFTKSSYWKHRGKLDVPKERFILYPDASRDGDGTPLLGWAGWDHAEQALALASVIHDREQEGWPDERLVPLIAGLAELQPWVDQWHGEVHPLYGVSLAAFCAEELARRAAQVSMTIEELRWWRPEKKGRGRGKA